MLEEIIKIQEKAVRNLLIAIHSKEEITFKAPTGSGKTIMMAEFMNKVIEGDNSVCFIVSSLSKGELAKQNYESFKERSLVENRLLNPYLISSQVTEEAGINLDPSYNVNEYLRFIYQTEPWIVSNGGTISRLYNDSILNAEIPLPPMKQQKHIVYILNMFYDMVYDVFSGIPAEIEARKKQYEYYREKLLTFKKLEK